MENGASSAYNRIDARVDETLQAAAKILRDLKMEQEEEKAKKTLVSITETRAEELSCTSVETRGTITIGTVHRSSKEPKATIRTPSDSMKSRNSVFFPPATVGETGASRTQSTLSGSSTGTYLDITSTEVASTPELFPTATYIPASKKASDIKMPITTRRAQASTSTQSIYRMQVQKLAIEPLVDISHLKCRGVKKSMPDDMFPKADYLCGSGKANLAISPVTSVSSLDSSTTASMTGETASSLAYLPMEFVSTDGRVKMLLKPMEEKKKIQKKEAEEFPIVPKQLQSCTKLKTVDEKRTKFMAKFSFFNNSIDLSGIWNGAKKGGSLVINGQHYSV